MEPKTSLEMYPAEKFEIRKEYLYDNFEGSALLFEARAGCLRTNSSVGKYTQNDGVCVVCGKETETIRHIVLECECIHLNLKAIEGTKRRLECWWKKSREGNIA